MSIELTTVLSENLHTPIQIFQESSKWQKKIHWGVGLSNMPARTLSEQWLFLSTVMRISRIQLMPPFSGTAQ